MCIYIYYFSQSLSSAESQSTSSSSKTNSEMSDEYFHDVQVNSDKSIGDANDDQHVHDDDKDDNVDERSEASIEYNFDADIMSSITSTLYPAEHSMC